MGSMYCDVCGDHLGYHCQGAPCPKPATTEPPEWKIAPVPQALLDLAEMERKARQEVCGITDLHRGVTTPKPATPEWKVETHVCPFCSATCAVGTFCTCERGQDEMRRWDTIMQAPAQSPLDRALEDFTARRKAKREKSDIEDFFEGSQWTADEVKRLKALNEQLRQDRLLCEAMSTPLPHDPPMSARLMPWRGK